MKMYQFWLVLRGWSLHAGLGHKHVSSYHSYIWLEQIIKTILPYFGKRKQVTHHVNLSYWCFHIFYLVCSSSRPNFMHIHWASKETYNFLEWCPLKSTASKWMIFGLMLATVLLITHVKKQRNRMCQKWDKCLQITTGPISKSQNLLPFHRADFRTLQ